MINLISDAVNYPLSQDVTVLLSLVIFVVGLAVTIAWARFLAGRL